MKTTHRAQLEEAIQNWIDDMVEAFDVGIWVHEDLVSQMTDAAAGVWDAVEANQRYLLAEGHLKDEA